MTKKLTIEEIVGRAKKAHENKYGYDLVTKDTYKNNRTKVSIICPDHGIFEQTMDHHLAGVGCMKCGGRVQLTTEDIIEKATLKHEGLYTYPNVSSSGNNKQKITITCRIHGDFSQRIDNHLNGQGCPACGKIEIVNALSLTLNEFVSAANKQHNFKYDYTKFIYQNTDTKGIIICPEHDEFLQTPHAHLGGQGCPHCRDSKGERVIARVLASLDVSFERQKKFENCKNIRCLPFDFYLPKHNMLIEFDGRQHEVAVECFGGKSGLEETQKNDMIKNQFCVDEGIKLIRISHKQYKQISEILLDQLSN